MTVSAIVRAYLQRYVGEIAIALACSLFITSAFLYHFARATPIVSAGENVREYRAAVVAANDIGTLPVTTKQTPHYIDLVEQGGKQTQVSEADHSVDVSAREPVVINGWAYDGSAARAATGVFLVADGRRRFAALYGDMRPDVARVTNVPLAVASGFVVAIPAEDLSLGSHHFDLDVIDAKGDAIDRQPDVLTLVVRP